MPFGGKYRIIDFPLSNCTNSGIDVVGVLTQYEPFVLNSYIGNGAPWDLDTNSGGAYVLSPYTHMGDEGNWYLGTADAIYQNIRFIDRFNPKYVVILSGDHIYKMDYSDMVAFHKRSGAAATIAVMPVPIEEASRFGILATDENARITDFVEKPANPPSNLASMGIYVFSWDVVRQYLIDDEANPDSSRDFGKDVIPAMLGATSRCTRTASRAIGATWAPSTACGKRTWTCWTAIPAWTWMTTPGRSTRATPTCLLRVSRLAPSSTNAWWPRAAT